MPKELENLLVGLTVTAVYGGFILLLFGWMRSRLYKRALAGAKTLEAAGATIRSTHKSNGFRQPAQVEFELGGQAARYQVRQYSRDFIVQSVRLPARPLPPILVRSERGLDRLGKSLGLDREVQVGDATFDAAAYIDSAAPDEVVKRALTPAVRERVLDLLKMGYWLDLSADGLGASQVRGFYSKFEVAELPLVIKELEAIEAALPRFDAAETSGRLRRGRWPIFAFLALCLGLATFPMIAWAHPPMDDLQSIRVFGWGLIGWAAVMTGLFFLLRGRPHGLRTLLLNGLILIFALPPLFAFALFTLNSRLDQGAVTTHRVQITMLPKREHTVYFDGWRPERVRDRVGTSAEVFRTLSVGDRVDIDTRPGALGWLWVPEVRRVQ